MTESLPENTELVLRTLTRVERDEIGDAWIEASELAERAGLEAHELNDVAELLVHSGYAEWQRQMGTLPYKFAEIKITPAGRFQLQRGTEATPRRPQDRQRIRRPPIPIGSPFGFEDKDWETIAERKEQIDELRVVLGFQFDSEHYESETLKSNIREMFEVAVREYNKRADSESIELVFEALAAGYGEHLFNEIARSIISSDIAVFETSDMNPNVMLEMGVALTWGVRVLPIKLEGRRKPPSDISGQTWADYLKSGAQFTDQGHDRKLLRMVQRAALKKG